jgi:hypothetical protein
MNSIRLAGILIIAFTFIIGCSGSNANIKNQSGDESKVTQQELINNWSDYNISYNSMVIVFDPKNDDKKILVNKYWSRVKDQETWTDIFEPDHNATGHDYIYKVWGNETREIWVHNQFYGYVIQKPRELVAARIVDENTVRLTHQFSGDWRG